MQSYSGIILVVVMVAVMYFLMIRPQQRQRAKHQEMVTQLKKGDKVVTIGRLHGVIDSVDEANKTVVLDVEGIYLTFDLAAIANVTPAETAAPVQAATPVEPASDEAEAVSSASEVASATADSESDSAEEK